LIKQKKYGIIQPMNILRKSLPAIILLLAGCTPVKLIMNVDTTLKDNAIVYEVSYPNSIKDKISGNRLNMSFGPYRVTDAKLSWTGIKTKAEDPDPLFSSKKTSTSGNVTTKTEIAVGPKSLFGYTRPADKGEPSIRDEFRSITYNINVGKQTTWNASCTHKAEKRVTQHETSTSVEVLSSIFTCEYKKAGKSEKGKSNNEVWILTVEYGGEGTITLTQEGKPNTLIAHSTGGIYVTSEGKPVRTTTGTAGYTWSQIKGRNEKKIAAISVREGKPRVWLDKGNSGSINQILSMANTGLLIYSWEIH
jgi:hypothetical protein